jgi:radical SAM protein with 4Fe4S-binding SPASM domain
LTRAGPTPDHGGVAPPRLAGSYLVLETTNQCSLACVHCTVAEGPAHPHHAQVGFMPEALLNAVLADLAAFDAHFDTLIPFWLGEPLLHPAFGSMYQSCIRAGVESGTFTRLELHTNATHLGRDRVRVALNAAPIPQTWHFSLDAASAPTYRRVKGRDQFEAVEANLLGLLDQQARTGAPWPRPVFQFIVGENNAHEAAAFAARWQGACRERGLPARTAAQEVPAGSDAIIFFRQLDAPDAAAQQRANRAFRATMAAMGLALPRPTATPPTIAEAPGVCGCFWKSPVVGWDGRVTTCVRDNRFENLLGNVHDSPLSEIWWGPRMRRGREAAARGGYAEFSACAGCYIPRSANYSDITPAEIRAWA